MGRVPVGGGWDVRGVRQGFLPDWGPVTMHGGHLRQRLIRCGVLGSGLLKSVGGFKCTIATSFSSGEAEVVGAELGLAGVGTICNGGAPLERYAQL